MHRLFFILACLLLFLVVLAGLIRAALLNNEPPLVTHLPELLDPGKHRMLLRIGNYDRKVIFITPKGFKLGVPLPLVFFFHGAGGSAQQASHTYGWAEKADAENFFVAFPEGMPARPGEAPSFLLNPHVWRDGRPGLLQRGVDDILFFQQLLKEVEWTLPIDSQRIYITGFSNGGGMTFTLGARFADQVAAIAPVSSQSFSHIDALLRPLSVYYLTGKADPLIPYNGGTVTLPWGNSRTTPPVQETLDNWVALDGLPPQPQIVSDENGVRVLRFSANPAKAEIMFTTIEGNGHHWPGTVEPLPHMIAGPSLDPFNATGRIWEFFKAHPLP